jgi:peptide/nickel transport system permease protein
VRQYVIRRLLLIPVTLVLLSLVFFGMLRAIPGDTVSAIFADPTAQDVEATSLIQLREDLGFNRPLHIQYLDWLAHMFRGDLGHSFDWARPVHEVLAERWEPTVQLMIMGVIGGLVLGVPLGILSAYKQDSPLDYSLRVTAITGITLPSFVVAALVLIVLVSVWEWMPPLEFVSFMDNPSENMKKMVFPGLVLIVSAAAPYMRLTRSQMLEVIREDYIRTARSKGLMERPVIIRHALKNAALPVLTIFGWQFAAMMAGSVTTEEIFSIPGLGRTLIDAIGRRDYIMIQSLVMVVAVMIMLTNLVVDVIYAWLDPRIRYS